MSLIILEHKSASYGPRTYHNASVADITVAIAANHNTAGEKCTQKAVVAAGTEIVKLPMNEDYLNSARVLWRAIKDIDNPTINVAGNGIATLHKYGWSQQQVNRIVYDILAKVNEYHAIGRIVAGGQTGVDLAGGVAAYKLGIDCVLTLPKGFKMRFQNGEDYDTSEGQVRNMVTEYASYL